MKKAFPGVAVEIHERNRPDDTFGFGVVFSDETLSFLAYRQNVTLVNLGMGSAVSVLLFLSVVLIAVIFVKGFRTDLSQVRGDR